MKLAPWVYESASESFFFKIRIRHLAIDKYDLILISITTYTNKSFYDLTKDAKHLVLVKSLVFY